ncbi:hypothetical protein KIF59_14350 [Enterobacter cloacae subsp. cloacae]|nr:hypothetical protein [Enterobacter cloacae subsp. cloacae]
MSQKPKSFAVTAYDPDAPTGSGFWHWVAYKHSCQPDWACGRRGKPARTHPASNTPTWDFGALRYGGCCPPEGDIPHRYIFTPLHALSCDDRRDAGFKQTR